MPFVLIARTEHVPPDEARFFCVDGKPLMIAHWSDRFFALDGLCPHMGFELHGAVLRDRVIECPWHHYQFDIRTGENFLTLDRPEKLQPLATYRVELKGTEIWVELA